MNRVSRLGVATLVVILAAGVWLAASPFVMQTQPAGASWQSATTNDVAVGGLLIGRRRTEAVHEAGMTRRETPRQTTAE